jgi:hypothetical protein
VPRNCANKNNRLIIQELKLDEYLHHYCVEREPDWSLRLFGFTEISFIQDPLSKTIQESLLTLY